ncbi:MAG: hypothetical protein IID39_05740, partial [Planctomycetes bacterium]|nr:hypothetical protein [Planctomycetota bacterium]
MTCWYASVFRRGWDLATGVVVCAVCALGAVAQEVGPQVRIDVGGGTKAANEPSIAASEANPLEIVGSWNDWRESGGSETIRVGVALSMDGGATWTDFLVRPPNPNRTNVEGDPMTASDPRTGDLWVGGIAFGGNGGVFVARKRPGNPNFDPAVMARSTGSADKGWMAAGPPPWDPNATRLYIAYNQGLIFSDDMGATWSNPRGLGGGIGFLPRVGPDGELYVAYWDFGTGVMILRSFDGGASFGPAIRIATRMDVWGTQDGSRFPGNFRVPSLNYIAVDPNDGTVYCVWFDTTDIVKGQRNVDLYFSKSVDQAATWSKPVVINDDADPPGDQFFPWLEVDPNGTLHLVFFDSRNTIQNDNVPDGMFDAYYSISEDGGATWTEFRLTPEPFNSRDDGLDRGDSQFIGDYSGLAVAGGRVFPCYLSTQNGDSDIFVNIVELDTGVIRPQRLEIIRGRLASGDLPDLFNSDDSRMVFQPGITRNPDEPPVWLELTGTSPTESPSELSFTLETRAD